MPAQVVVVSKQRSIYFTFAKLFMNASPDMAASAFEQNIPSCRGQPERTIALCLRLLLANASPVRAAQRNLDATIGFADC